MDTIVSLRDQLEEAREEILQLKAVIAGPAIHLYRGLHLTASQSLIMETLIEHEVVSTEMLMARISIVSGRETTPRSLQTQISKLRDALSKLRPPVGIAKMQYDAYRLSPEARALLITRRIR